MCCYWPHHAFCRLLWLSGWGCSCLRWSFWLLLLSHRHHHFPPSLLPSCLPSSFIVSFLFTFLAPSPILTFPLLFPYAPILFFFIFSPLLLFLFLNTSSLLRLSFLILIGPYPPHTLCRWCLLERNLRQLLLFCSTYTFHPVLLIYINIHIFIYISVHLGSPLRTASTAVDFAPSVLAVRFLVGSK